MKLRMETKVNLKAKPDIWKDNKMIVMVLSNGSESASEFENERKSKR